jgi:hypothetical protein
LLTLSVSASEIDPDLQPKLDDQGMANDITASRVGGITTRVVDADSITDYGYYRETLELITTSDDEVADAAYWTLYQRGVPVIRVPVCTVNLANLTSGQVAAVLALEIGDCIALSNLPAQAPASTMPFFIEGITHQISADIGHRITFNLSPAGSSSVWVLDSATYSVLGTSTRLAY